MKGVVETTGKNEPPMKDQAPPEQMISTGRKEMQDPQKKGLAATALKEAFGDLINPSELLRMGVVFLGALATGATPIRSSSDGLMRSPKGFFQSCSCETFLLWIFHLLPTRRDHLLGRSLVLHGWLILTSCLHDPFHAIDGIDLLR